MSRICQLEKGSLISHHPGIDSYSGVQKMTLETPKKNEGLSDFIRDLTKVRQIFHHA